MTDPGGAERGLWWAMGFANQYGDVAQAWSCRLPDDFVTLLDTDLERLGDEVAVQAAALHGKVIKIDRVLVDGRPAFLRIVRLPGGGLPGAVYVAGVVVPIDDETGVEITLTCGALGELLSG
jgi:hypothetical protein